MKVKLLCRVRLFVTTWTVAYQAPPSMGFSRQEYWNGLPLPSLEFLCSHFNIEDGRKKQHFQHIMLYYFKKGKSTTEMQKKICAAYGEGPVTD